MLDSDRIQELFAAFGRVSARGMFDGAGLYADGLIFALVADGVIYLKATPDGAAAFEREGCEPFTYAAKGGKRAVMSYWRMPERLYDDPDELAIWARAALATAQAKQAENRPRKPGPTQKSW
jgi:DNA transformation protein and related proteins